VGEDYAENAGKPPAADASDSASGSAPRRVFWLVVVLSIAAIAGLLVQTQRFRASQEENARLTGELFATRSALDAYVTRFAAVRESVDGLQAQFEKLDALVSWDPLAPEPESETEPTAESGD
jgi:uncharacterized protein HemX